MRRVAITSGLFLALLILGVQETVPAQSPQQTPGATPPVALMFDEYGALRSCDHSARMDNFAIQLQNMPGSHGYLVIYAPQSGSEMIGDQIKDYLVNSRGISGERIEAIHAGLNNIPSEPRIQLWVAPEGAPAPEPEKFEMELVSFKGMFAEEPGWDHIAMPDAWGVDEGFSHGVPSVSHAAFGEILKAQKDSVAYVVAYSGVDDVPGAWRRVAESTVKDLKGDTFDAGRFKIIYGGIAKGTKIQTWILPAGDPPPVQDAGAEPPLTKSIQLGDFGEYELGSAEGEQAVLARIVDVLGNDSKLRACVIVRVQNNKPAEEPDVEEEPIEIDPDIPENEIQSEPQQPEREPADLLKLVEKWKTQLAAKHKIREDRFIILFSTAREDNAGSLETWIVPAGHPLPDPAHSDEEPENEAKKP